jgi:sulfatase maturation enzyme AslB (radical SAM superfamily)
VCDYLEQHQSHIREVALVGGEPLLLPENSRLLDVIPQDCIVTLITNVSVDLDNNKIFKKLSQRNRVGWSLSFDNIQQRFEYVRHGGTWPLLLKNLSLIQNLMSTQGHWGGIHAVYNIYNATRLVELTEFARNQGLTIHWQSLYQPEYLDPQRLGVKTVELAKAEIDNLLATTLCLETEREFFQQVQHTLHNTQDLAQEFGQHIEQIENQYHADQQGQFAKLWPELDYLCN